MLSRWSRAAKRWTPLLLVAAGLLGAMGSAQAVLQARDLNGDTFTDAYYDTALDITWLKDANAAGLNRDWSSANSWAEGLVFGGYDDWRLARTNGTGPIESRVDCLRAAPFECAAGGNELGYMYAFNIEGRGNRTAFDDSIQHYYWSGTKFDTLGRVWAFNFDYGIDFFVSEHVALSENVAIGYGLSAWAVRPGDVIAAVPEPETYAMLLAGLGLLGFAARRRKQRGLRQS